MKRIAITGYGIADSLGSNLEQCFHNLLGEYNPVIESKRNGLQDYPNIKTRLAAQLYPDNIYNLSRCIGEQNRPEDYIKIALHTVNEALDLAKIKSNPNGAIIYTSIGPHCNVAMSLVETLAANKTRFSPRFLLENEFHYISGCIARTFGIIGSNTSMDSACATTLVSLDYARYLTEEHDYVIVGASDIITSPFILFSFQQYGALTQSHSCPFDKKRNGFVIGEGAGCLVLEAESKALARGAKIYGYVSGIGLASDLESAHGLNKTSAEIAMVKALNSASINKVDFVNAHATSTVHGDQIEYDLIKKYLPDTPIFSAKGKIGHTMAACGVIELIYGLGVFQYGIIPRNFNLTDPLANDECLLQKSVTKECRSFIKNSYGFGGRSASVVITKPD